MRRIVSMYRTFFIVACSIILTACNADNEEATPSAETIDNPDKTEQEKNTGEPVLHLLTPDGIPPIITTSFSSPFGDNGNIKFQHTEIEVVDKFSDTDGRIYFDLNDNPIRHILGEDGKNNYIANYYDAFIDIKGARAYDLTNQDHINEVYNFFILNPSKELADKDPSDYRSWEEATNLERGTMAVTDLLVPYLNHVGFLIEDDIYSGEQFDQVIKEFELLGSPLTILPAPQTVYDVQLYENISMVQSLWRQLADIDNPQDNKDEFKTLYEKIREEMNHLIVRINFILSER